MSPRNIPSTKFKVNVLIAQLDSRIGRFFVDNSLRQFKKALQDPNSNSIYEQKIIKEILIIHEFKGDTESVKEFSQKVHQPPQFLPHPPDSIQSNTVTQNQAFLRAKNETIGIKTFIEIDMHGSNNRYISQPLDWVPILRDLVIDCVKYKVDGIRVICGIGNNSRSNSPVLRPLAFMTLKRMNYECTFHDTNDGLIICLMTSKSDNLKTINIKTVSHYNIDLNINILKKILANEIIPQDLDDNSNPTDVVKKYFNEMPDVCVDFICYNRKTTEAYKQALLFEKFFNAKNFLDIYKNGKRYEFFKDVITNDEDELNTQILECKEKINSEKNEKKIIEKIEKDIIEKIMKECNYDIEKCNEILDQIEEIPEDFLDQFQIYVNEYNSLKIELLLNTCKKENYEKNKIDKILISSSMNLLVKTDNIFESKLLSLFDTIREQRYIRENDFPKPKSFPVIEINLSSATIDKAMRLFDRLMPCIKKGNYLAILFIFGKNYYNSCDEASTFRYLIKLCEDKKMSCKDETFNGEKWFFINYDKKIKEEINNFYSFNNDKT